MKNYRCLYLPVVIIFIFLLSCSVMAEPNTKYIALGDSIARGYGLEDTSTQSYPSIIANDKSAVCTNLGIDGQDSTQLLSALQNGDYDNVLKDAGIITISIGSNDLLKPVQNNIKGVMEINEELEDNEVLNTAIDTFENNFPLIINELKEKAPNANIYVGNIYNPYKGVDIAEKYIVKLNETFSDSSTEYTLIDLYTVFDESKTDLVNAQLNFLDEGFSLDPHPNADGHKAIAKSFEEKVELPEINNNKNLSGAYFIVIIIVVLIFIVAMIFLIVRSRCINK